MKYLKMYNESNNQYNLQEFCETHLAYLLDEGYEVEYVRIEPLAERLDKYTQVTIKKGSKGYVGFNWKSIQDHLIPFLKRLSDNYELKKFYGYGTAGEIGLNGISWGVYTLKEILNEQSDRGFPTSVNMIRIKVKDKKFN